MFCSCGLLGSFLFARHVISLYNVLSGRAMFNINRKDSLFLALSNFDAGSGGLHVSTSSTGTSVIKKNTTNTDKRITTIKKMVQESNEGVFSAHDNGL